MESTQRRKSSRGRTQAGRTQESSTAGFGRMRRTTDGHGRDDGRAPAGRLAGGLGWFSIGLGLAQILGPGEVARMVGLGNDRRTRSTMTAIGVREIASGLGILSANKRSRFLWMRVGGDVVDLALLGSMLAPRLFPSRRRSGGRMIAGLAAIGAVTMLDALAARRVGRTQRDQGRTTRRTEPGLRGTLSAKRTVTATTTIRRPADEVYRFWRELENLPSFMAHVESIEVTDDRHSHWTVRAPAGVTVEWDAEIVEDRPGELITWRSLPGASIDNRGTVRFVAAPGDRGTEVHAEITYAAPGGRVGAMIAKLFGREPGQQAKGDLRRFKQVLETGEVVHSDASIHGMPHPAQPPTRRFLAKHELGSGRGPRRGRQRPAPQGYERAAAPAQPQGYGVDPQYDPYGGSEYDPQTGTGAGTHAGRTHGHGGGAR